MHSLEGIHLSNGILFPKLSLIFLLRITIAFKKFFWFATISGFTVLQEHFYYNPIKFN